MFRLSRWSVLVIFGLVLPGRGEDFVRTEDEILPLLGRVDLVDPEDLLDWVTKPLPIEVPAEDDDAPVPFPEGLDEGEADTVDSGLLPPIKAGEGPGTVEGVVYDADGVGVPGVILTLPEMAGFQVRTDESGAFRVTGLPVTGVTAEFLKPGFLVKTEVFQVREEGVTKVRVSLEMKPVELADGEYVLEGQEVILDYEEEEQGGGIGIVADTGPGLAGGGLSKDFLSKAGASDAAGAVEKISGANVVGGKFVVVRGLGDRYNNTTLNGGFVPSPETSRKAVQLDLFPSDVLEAVSIQKTGNPSLPADFVGGIVQLQTLQDPGEDFLSLSMSTKWHAETLGHGKFFTVKGMELSSDLRPDNFAPLPTLRTRDSGEEARRQRQAFFDAVKFGANRKDPALDLDLSGAFSKKWDWGANSRFTLFGTLGHSSSQRYRLTEQSRFRNALQLTPEVDPNSLNPRFADLSTLREQGGLTLFNGLTGNYQQDQYTDSRELSALISGKLEVGENLDLTGTFFNFRSGESTFTLIDRGVTDLPDLDLSESSDALARGAVVIGGQFEAESYRRIYEQVYRELQFGQLGGQYRLNDWREGAQINWNAYHSETSETSPRSYELLGFFLRDLTTGESGISIPNPAQISNPKSSSLVQYATEDEAREFKVDGTLPLIDKTEDRKVNLVTGVGHYQRDRESNTKAAILANGGRLTSVNDAYDATDRLLNDLETGTPNAIGSSDQFVPGSSALGVTQNYLGSNRIESMFLAMDAEWDQWFLLGGVRYEEETRAFNIPGDRRGTGSTITDDIFPSLDFGRHFGVEKNWKTVLSYSETVVRPTFYEFIPARILDLTNRRIIVGNRDLRETQAQNFDFRLSWEKDQAYLGFNLFHKIIQDPIFTVNDPSGAADRTFVNLGETEVSGIELEGSYDLGSGFSVTGNLSLIRAEAQPGLVRVNQQEFLGEIDRLEGQPDMLGNFILSWENEDSGWATNLIYTYTGEYLTVASLGFVGQPGSALPNEVRQPFHSLDWNLTKKWSTDLADYQLRFSVRNLLDSDVEVRYDGLSSAIAPAEAYSPGREFGLSFKASF